MLASPRPPASTQAPAPFSQATALASTLKQKVLFSGSDQPAGQDWAGRGAHAAAPLAYVPTGHEAAVNAQEGAPAVE
jgi:hypothetical protein